MPVLLRAVEQIKAQGHNSEVGTTMIDNYVNPSVSLSFLPSPAPGGSGYPASRLTLRCGGKDGLLIAEAEYWGKSGRSDGARLGQTAVETADADWVNQRVRGFVKNVLDGM